MSTEHQTLTQFRRISVDVIRYCLAVLMLPYAVSKLIGVQFTVVPFSAWQLPLEELEPFQLSWAFLGYSSWFQFTIGIFEFVPCMLLFFRRTTLLGALLMLPLVVGVTLINFSLNLSSYTEVKASAMLLLNLSLLSFHYKILSAVLSSMLAKRHVIMPGTRAKGFLSLAALIALSIYYAKTSFYTADMENFLTGYWRQRKPYEWNLVQETVDDSIVKHRKLKMYFMPHNAYTEINDNSHNRRFIEYDIDEDQQLITFRNVTSPQYPNDTYMMQGTVKYELRDDSILYLTQLKNAEAHSYTFRRRIINSDHN